jgi:hypothetical protein
MQEVIALRSSGVELLIWQNMARTTDERIHRKDASMLRQSLRFSKSIALGFALCIAAAAATGCSSSSAETDETPVVPSDVQSVRITAVDTDSLTADEFYKVNLQEKIVYRFDYSDKQIAYDRVQLVTPKGEMLLSDEMAKVQEGDYGDYPQPNLLAASNKRFSIASNAADFGVLTQSELDQLKTTGFFYDEKALEAPKSSPQSTDNCIHATCEFCFENGTSSPPVSWQPGTYHCYYEEHVWCD